MFDKNQPGYLYPLCKQPLIVHPKVAAFGDDAVSFILTQSFYKYTHDIALIETRFINQTILDVITGAIDLPFSEEQKINLYTVMVDEAYHAYVAYDAMQQIQNSLQIKPLKLPMQIEIEVATNHILQHLPERMHSLFKLIAVCIAENTLSQEIRWLLGDKATHPFFQQMLREHLLDEGRHSNIFIQLLSFIWSQLNETDRMSCFKLLPRFISQYLSTSIQQQFERQVLLSLSLDSEEIVQILSDIYGHFRLTFHHPMLQHILSAFKKAGIFQDHMTESCFAGYFYQMTETH